MKPKVVGIGELLWDMLPGGKRLGGAPANFAFYAKELGARSGVVSAVGEDALGDELMERTSGLGIDTSAVQRNRYPTGVVDVTLTGDGVPEYVIREDVAWDHIARSELTTRAVADARAVCWGSLAQRSATSCRSIEEIMLSLPQKCLKVFDINIRLDYFSEDVVRRSMEQADLLKLNEDELPLVARMFGFEGAPLDVIMRLIERFGLSHVIYTRGAEDSLVVENTGRRSLIETPHVKVADTVGAGDSFTAAFVTGMLYGLPMEECHRCAVEVSAFVCTLEGAIAPLPEYITAKTVHQYI